ncbi:hypothetical protein J3A83DRAFT_4366711 [Scleroderma citrinum]
MVSQKQSLSSIRHPGSSLSYGAPAMQSRKAGRRSFQPLCEQELVVRMPGHIGLGGQVHSRALVSVQDDPFVDLKPAQAQLVVPAPEQAASALSPAETIHASEPFDPRSPGDETTMPIMKPVTISLRPLHEVISTC